MHLRPATVADASELAQIYIASREKFLPFAPLAHTEQAIQAWVRDDLLQAKKVTLVVAGGVSLGFVASVMDGDILWIDQLYLRPESVGQGFGAALLRSALAGPVCPVRLYTFQANEGARRFYERFGFVAIALSDGQGNEEKCPDVLYEARRAANSVQAN